MNKVIHNPFTPNFGQVPNYFAGRQEIISEWLQAFDNIPGDPAQTTLLIGARGTGKTALLTYFSQEIQSQGWISVNVPCVKGMLEDIYQQALIKSEHLLRVNNKDTGISLNVQTPILGAGISFKNNKIEYEPNWQSKMTDIIQQLNNRDIGLLITIDEVNMSNEEMNSLAGFYQMFIREGLKVSLMMAGLPHNVSLLLNSSSNSFLRRASQKHIGNLPDYEIRNAMQKTIEMCGKDIGDSALDAVVQSINGYPYMFQLVGFRSWMEAGESKIIEKKAVQKGIEIAKLDMESRILKITLDDISDVGIMFLKTMLEDKDYSTLDDIAKRLGKTKSYTINYKNRLCEYGVIEDMGRGKYRFALPGLREYLKEYSI